MKLTTIDKIKVMQHYLKGGKIEVSYYDEGNCNWYLEVQDQEPEWNWEMCTWRVATKEQNNG